MLSYDSPSAQRRTSRSTRPAAQSEEADSQSLMGNGFMASQLGATFEDGSPIPTHQGSEVTEDHDPATRDKDVGAGDIGALIGTGTDIQIRHGRTRRARELARVPDGTPCEVLERRHSKIRVRVRVGEKSEEGWTEATNFSKQPGLSNDEEHEGVKDDFNYAFFTGDHDPIAPKGTDTAQGALGDCFFIASMAAIANAQPSAISDAITYNSDGTYTVRFYEEQWSGESKPVYITVDAYLPTSGATNDPAYAGDPGAKLWPAIMEKAYAQWKGGYDVIGEGGTGHEAMADISGQRSRSKNPSSMRGEDVVPYFQGAMADGLAIYAGVRNSMASEVQTPLSGSASGPYKGKVSQTHRWNEIEPGTLRITDDSQQVGAARDRGHHGDHDGEIGGHDVDSGAVNYKEHSIELAYREGREPASAADLQVHFEYHGMLNEAKTLIGNHAYAFERVVDGDKLQFYNPWGSWQPKPITADEFLEYFDSLSTNKVPAEKTSD